MPFLDWVNKNQATEASLKVPYHLLKQVSTHGDVSGEHADNLLIQGDNLQALKALLPFYRGQVKCIFIDPPYNTQSAFEHYDDRLEHSQWLTMMYPRLVLLRELLAEDGSIWVTLDDNEAHYCKVLMDEIFGRSNFVNTVSVNMKNIAGASGGGEDKKLKKNIEYIHAYSKNYYQLKPFDKIYDYIPMAEVIEQYRKEGKSWKYTAILFYAGDKKYIGSTADGDGNEIKIYLREKPIYKSINQVIREENLTEKEAYDKYAEKIFEAKDAQSSIRARVIEARSDLSIEEDLISIEYVPKTGRNKSVLYEQFYKGKSCRLFAWLRDIGETIDGVLHKKNRLGTYWDATSAINNLTKEGGVQFANGKKPESIINKIIQMSTVPGDLVLDSFLGSGSTAAVAHKMGRRYIGIEMGEHARSHCLHRLENVIAGEQGGISKAVNWSGGGGFRFCTLGNATFDANGTIHPDVKFSTLAGYLWHFETGTPGKARYDKPRLGTHNGTAYYLLYNGILGDRRPDGGNVLTAPVLQMIEDSLPHAGPKVIYGETTSLGAARLAKLGISFKQIPYDLPLR